MNMKPKSFTTLYKVFIFDSLTLRYVPIRMALVGFNLYTREQLDLIRGISSNWSVISIPMTNRHNPAYFE